MPLAKYQYMNCRSSGWHTVTLFFQGSVNSSERQYKKVLISFTDMFVIDNKEKSPWLITKLFVIKKLMFSFVIDHKKSPWLITKVFVIKKLMFSFVIYHKPFCFCNVGMQECFVINYGKGCLCDVCSVINYWSLWQITKSSKVITIKYQEIP